MLPSSLGTGIGTQASSERGVTDLITTWFLLGDGRATPPFALHLDLG